MSVIDTISRRELVDIHDRLNAAEIAMILAVIAARPAEIKGAKHEKVH